MEACGSFTQHAWKKDLCANCMKPRDKHAASGPVPTSRRPRAVGAGQPDSRPVFSEVRGVLGARSEVSQVRNILGSPATSRGSEVNGSGSLTNRGRSNSPSAKPSISAKPDLLRDTAGQQAPSSPIIRSPQVGRAPTARISDIELEDEHFRPANKESADKKASNSSDPVAETDAHYYHKYDTSKSISRKLKGPRGPYLEQVTHKHVPVEDFKVNHDPKDLPRAHPRLSELADVPVVLPYNIVDVCTIPVNVDPKTLEKNPPKVPGLGPENTSANSSTCSSPSFSGSFSTVSSLSKKSSPDSACSPHSGRKNGGDSPTSRRHNNNGTASPSSDCQNSTASSRSRMIILRNEFFKGFDSQPKDSSPGKNDNPYEPVNGESDEDTNSNSDVSSHASTQKAGVTDSTIATTEVKSSADMSTDSANSTPSKKRKNSIPSETKEEKKDKPKKNGRSFFSRWFGFGGQEEEEGTEDASAENSENKDETQEEKVTKGKEISISKPVIEHTNGSIHSAVNSELKEITALKLSSLERRAASPAKQDIMKNEGIKTISTPRAIPAMPKSETPENSPITSFAIKDSELNLLDEIESILQIQPTYETGSDLMRISTHGTLGGKKGTGTWERPRKSPPPEPRKRVTIDENVTKLPTTPPQAKKRTSLERQKQEGKERDRDEDNDSDGRPTLQREGSGLSSRKLKRPPSVPPPPPASLGSTEKSPPLSPVSSNSSTLDLRNRKATSPKPDSSIGFLGRSTSPRSGPQENTQRRKLEISAPQLQRTSMNLEGHLSVVPKSDSGGSLGSQSPSDTYGSATEGPTAEKDSGSSGDGSVGSFYSLGSDGKPRNAVERRSMSMISLGGRLVRRMNQAPPPPPDGGMKRMSTGDFISMPPMGTQTLPRPPKNRGDSLTSNPDETLLPTKKDKKKEKTPRSKTLTEGVKFDLDKFSFNLRSKDKNKVQDRALPAVPKSPDQYIEENKTANHYEMVAYEDVYDDIPEDGGKSKNKKSPKRTMPLSPPPIPPMMQSSAEYLEPISAESSENNSGGSIEIEIKAKDSPKPLVPRQKSNLLNRKPTTKAAEQYVLMYANKDVSNSEKPALSIQEGYHKMVSLHHDTLHALMCGLFSEFLPEPGKFHQDLKWRDFQFPSGKKAIFSHFGCALHRVTSSKEGMEDCSLMVSVNSPAANVIDFNHINVLSPVATFQDLVSADFFGDQSSSSPSRYKVYGSQTTTVVVLNYTDVTSLEDYLEVLNSAYDSDPTTYDRSVCYIMLQILNGLIYMQGKGCAIRSLGTRDILVVNSNGYNDKYIVLNPHCRQRPEISLQSAGKEIIKVLFKLLHVEVATYKMKQDLSVRIPTRSVYSRSFQKMVQILEGKEMKDIILARNLMDFMLWGPDDDDLKIIGCAEDREQAYEVWLAMEQCKVVSRYAIEGVEPLLEEANLMRFLGSADGAMLFEVTKCLHK